MPRGRKRKDPDPTYPIDGRYQGQDTVLNPVEGRRYAFLDPNAPQHGALAARGFHVSERSPDRKDVPMYDVASKDDTHYRVGNLVMFEADASPESVLAVSEARNIRQADRRLKAIGDKAKGTGGQIKVQVQHQPMVR